MQRLTGVDAAFLYTETPTTHMHVASACVFDVSDVRGGYSFERVKEVVINRLPLLPPFRRRLAEIPFQLHHPLWIEDPDFDIDYHVRRAALPSPGGAAELADFCSHFMSVPLDRKRPLWEMYLVEGLEHGYVATVAKTHHSAIDGVSGAELMVNLLDLTPETVVVPEDADTWEPDRVPTDTELVAYALRSLAGQPWAAAKAVRRTVETALNIRRRNRLPGVVPPPAPFSAPRTSINTSLTPHRRFAWGEVSLDDVKVIKNALGGTVNDVVLALCAGALRTYFEEMGETVDGDLVAMVPISVRTEDQKGTMGNRVSSMMVSLATTVADPVERLKAITDSTAQAKDQDKAIGAELLSNWAEFAAPAVAARAARLASSLRVADRTRPMFNVIISNVPGPNFPLYSAGARMVAMYPMGPVMDGVGLNITVMSYMGTLCFGLIASREVVPRLDVIAAAIPEGAKELLKATGTVSPARARPQAKSGAKVKAAPRARAKAARSTRATSAPRAKPQAAPRARAKAAPRARAKAVPRAAAKR